MASAVNIIGETSPGLPVAGLSAAVSTFMFLAAVLRLRVEEFAWEPVRFGCNGGASAKSPYIRDRRLAVFVLLVDQGSSLCDGMRKWRGRLLSFLEQSLALVADESMLEWLSIRLAIINGGKPSVKITVAAFLKSAPFVHQLPPVDLSSDEPSPSKMRSDSFDLSMNCSDHPVLTPQVEVARVSSGCRT